MERYDILIRAKNLRVFFTIRMGFFERRYLKAVDGVDLEIGKGETLAIVGESGSGKTTLGKTLLRLYMPTEGSILFDGKDITKASEKELKWYRKVAQIIYQDPFSSVNPFFNVYKILEEPLIAQGIGTKKEREEKIFQTMHDIKLEPIDDFAGKYPHMLSGGQRQRVAIGRAIILNPRFIVADEPVSMLDASVRVEILNLLQELQKKHGITFAYITHDIATVKYFSERIAIMYAGKIVEIGPLRNVIAKALHPYTEALIEAIPDPDPRNRFHDRHVPTGEPPDLIAPPTGCRFNPRCPYAIEICKSKEPILEEIEPKHKIACWARSREKYTATL
ncbi:MAG: ABC transporter ATP-binding protein [Candidatus Bathyarchaeia archaeon]